MNDSGSSPAFMRSVTSVGVGSVRTFASGKSKCHFADVAVINLSVRLR